MSSQYPILGGRPIDHWKVTELKEELKRRKLTTKGLKDDLIKRLDEAIRVEREALRVERETLRVERETLRVERENAVEDVNNKVNLGTQPMVEVKNAEVVPIVAEKAKDLMDNISNKIEKVDYMAGQVDINASVEPIGQGTVQEGAIKDDISLFRVEGEPTLPVTVTAVDSNAIVTETVVAQAALGGQAVQNSETEMDYKNSNIQMESEDTKLQLDNVEKKPQLEIQDSKPQLENEGLKAEPDVSMLDSSAPDNQVPEVSPNLGSQVNSDSISTDSVSINEKIDLKDNIIADNVKLELDVVKPEIVEPSPSNVVPVSGESHLMDVEESQQNKASVEENYDSNATNGEMSQKNDIVDLGDSEKLNLDAGDDSMEEDVLEGKQDDLKYNSDEVGDRSEKSEAPIVEKESAVDAVGTVIPTDQKEILGEDNNQSAPPLEKRKLSDTDQKEIRGENNNWLEKRKLNDKDSVGSAEPAKRQRRWNSETIKTPEPQSSTPKATATPKDGSQPTLKRNFSRSDSSVTEDPAKERIVPPSQNPATNSLRIDRFLRPFTLKAVQELLGKTGKVTSFWMDPIKTHCYVTYSSVEEAIETRNSVYNLQWPPNGGRLLVAEFVEPQEVKMMVEGPPQSPAASVTPTGAAPGPAIMPQPSPRVQVSRQQLPPPPALPPPPPLSNPPVVKERFAHPPPPPHQEKHDPPIVTLDDLFRKTKATPRIYYLPLSEEQATARCRKTKQ